MLRISIQEDRWLFGGAVINSASPAEGLLMNVRTVNSVFEDRSPGATERVAGFDPDANSDAFISKIPEYVANGVNAFTLCLQGGHPGFEGAVNTAFEADGSLRASYQRRAARVIEACALNGAAVILSCFYQRQHSHASALSGMKAILAAVGNVVRWIGEEGWAHVLLEIANEYRHGGFRHWPDADWLTSEAGQVELMQHARSLDPRIRVSTSGMGDGEFHEALAEAADFILIHFNGTALEDYSKRIEALRRYGKPIVVNEDDKVNEAGAAALAMAVRHGAGWGYMHQSRNQHLPFHFTGISDDPAVYRMFTQVTRPGVRLSADLPGEASLTITSPTDGQVFRVGNTIPVQVVHQRKKSRQAQRVVLIANGAPVADLEDDLALEWAAQASGTWLFEAVAFDDRGEELYRSRKVDIIVDPAPPAAEFQDRPFLHPPAGE